LTDFENSDTSLIITKKNNVGKTKNVIVKFLKIKKEIKVEIKPNIIKVTTIFAETITGHSFLFNKLSLTSLKQIIYKLLAEKKVSILKAVQKIANAANVLNDSL